MDVCFRFVAWLSDLLEGSLTVATELIELGEILGGVLLELEEASRVILSTSVAEIVELGTESIPHILLQLGAVL